MPIPDEERDRQFKRDVEKGLSITELSTKYQIGKRQVSRLKKKLGLTSTQIVTPTPTLTKRMTFWLPVPVIQKIKKKAVKEKRTASALIRDILDRHL